MFLSRNSNNDPSIKLYLMIFLWFFIAPAFAGIEVINAVSVKSWGNVGASQGQFRNPYGIAYDKKNETIFVSDCLNNTIKKFDLNGNLLKEWGSKGSGIGQFDYPAEVLVTQSNELLISDEKNHRIHRYDLEGNFLGWFVNKYGSGDGELDNPLGLAEDSKGNIYVVDSLNYRVQKFNSNGVFIEIFAGQADKKSYDADKFYGPYFIAIDNQDNVYVSDPSLKRVSVFDKNKALIDILGVDYLAKEYFSNIDSEELGRFSQPLKIVYQKETEELWVADMYNDRVQIYTNGKTLSKVINVQGNRPKIIMPLTEDRFLTGAVLSLVGIFLEWSIDPVDIKNKENLILKSTKHRKIINNAIPERLSTLLENFEHGYIKKRYGVDPLYYLDKGLSKDRYIYLPVSRNPSKVLTVNEKTKEYNILENTLFLTEIKNKLTGDLLETRVTLHGGESEYVMGSYTPEGNDSFFQKGMVPYSQECLFCHATKENGLLGVTPAGLDDYLLKINTQVVDGDPSFLQKLKNRFDSITARSTEIYIADGIKYLELNCAYCHDGGNAADFGLSAMVKNQYIDLSDISSSKLMDYINLKNINNSELITLIEAKMMPFGATDADVDGAYLMRTLASHIEREENQTFISSLKQTLSENKNIERYRLKKINLKTKKSYFNIDGFSSIQGPEFVDCCGKIVFATGYANSVALFNKNIPSYAIVDNPDGELPSLMSDVSSDHLGNLYATSWHAGSLIKYDKNLKKPRLLLSGLTRPIGVDVTHEENRIVVANHGNDEIIVLDLNGKLIWRKKIGNFHRPYGVEVKDGVIYATFSYSGDMVNYSQRNSVVKISLEDGDVLSSISPFLPDGTSMNNIQGLSIGPKGNVYVVDTEHSRIVVFDKNLQAIAILFNKDMNIIRGLDVNSQTGDIVVTGYPKNAQHIESETGAWVFEPIFQELH